MRAFDLLQGCAHGFFQTAAGCHEVLDQVNDDFRIGIGVEFDSLECKFLAQLQEVLDDAVVDHNHLAGRPDVRVCVPRAGFAMRSPTGVSNAKQPLDRLVGYKRKQVISFPASRRTSIFPCITAIPAELYPRYSKRLRPFKMMGVAFRLAYVANNATHAFLRYGMGTAEETFNRKQGSSHWSLELATSSISKKWIN